jgi:hypothetical protein
VNEIVNDVKILLSTDQINEINTMLEGVKLPDMSDEDNTVVETNKKLKIKVFSIVGIGLLMGLFIVWISSHVYGFSFFKLIKHNIIILGVVAITEYVFLYYFVKNYTSIDSNNVKYIILKNFQTV